MVFTLHSKPECMAQPFQSLSSPGHVFKPPLITLDVADVSENIERQTGTKLACTPN